MITVEWLDRSKRLTSLLCFEKSEWNSSRIQQDRFRSSGLQHRCQLPWQRFTSEVSPLLHLSLYGETFGTISEKYIADFERSERNDPQSIHRQGFWHTSTHSYAFAEQIAERHQRLARNLSTNSSSMHSRDAIYYLHSRIPPSVRRRRSQIH